MKDVLIFSGTVDGRALARYLVSRGVKVHVRVATEYGAVVMEGDGADVQVGSCGGSEGIAKLLREEGYGMVVDATHPYARNISAHIREGCEATGVPMFRLVRDGISTPDGIIEVPSVKDAVDYLMDKEGRILALTGSNDLAEYSRIPDYRTRVIARVLSVRQSLEKALSLGFEGTNLIAAQGPFTEGENIAAIERSGASWVVTKNSGTIGGFEDKVHAAKKTGAKIVLISKPVESGMDFRQVVEALEDELGLEHEEIENPRRKAVIVGIGMGPDGLTQRALKRLESCDVLIGAGRMLEAVEVNGRRTLDEYRPAETVSFLKDNPQYHDIGCLMSGDTGFYSGAKKLSTTLQDAGFEVEIESGISSVVYLASRIGISWDDACITSAHGRDTNIVGLVNTNPKVFTLLSKDDNVRSMCDRLLEYGLDVEIVVGQDLGYPNERVVRGKASELISQEFDKLSVMFILNPDADPRNPLYIPDEDFIRGDAPMTKSEIRTLSVAKLKLCKDSVIYDVGAGTGSVSIEMAATAVQGRVYAIEKEDVAADLIEENKRRFRTSNVTVVRGLAPEAMKDLPAPTHAFIGGSSGNLKDIIRCLLDKNPDVCMVINSVTIETMAETVEAVKELGLVEEELVCVNVSRSKRLGGYHLMFAQNPVYIAVVRGR